MFKRSVLLGLAALVCASTSSTPAASVSTAHFTDAELQQINDTTETMSFQTEVARMMDIIINSLYTKREVFLRELISNASDALEKARYLAVSNSDYLKDKSELEIRIEYDSEAKTLTITDTGVGMSRADLINNLGTLAKSGTTNFLEAVAGGGDLSLIGQFGVGFYASYLVADRVTVVSKKNDDDQYVWISSADAKFSVAKDPRGNTLGRGTQIILHLKDDAAEFMNDAKIKELTTTYSEFTAFPLYVKEVITSTNEVPDEDNVDPETNEPGTKSVEVTEEQWTHVNTQKAIWLRSKDEVSEQEYADFYKSISKDRSTSALAHTHFSAEGDVEFKSILYIPEKAPHDMFEQYYSKGSNIKLYVRRVLVSDNLDDILPRYLHFIKGVVDSDDLPLNVSREQLQQNKVMNTISKTLIKKVLDMLTKLSRESLNEKEKKNKEATTDEDKEEKKNEVSTYDKFYKEFSRSIKMGCYEDETNRSKIVKLIRYNSHMSKEPITLDQYISHMKPEQEGIYYIAGESIAHLRRSPHMQAFIKRGIDVLYLTESMDEPCLQKANEYSGKRFISIQKGDIKFNETDDEKKRVEKLKQMYEPLTKWLGTHLKSKAAKVEISQRLVDHPMTVVSSPYGYSAQMEKMMKSQAFADYEQMKFLMNLRNVEINPNHPIIIELLERVKANGEEAMDAESLRIVDILFHTATIAAGFDPIDATELATKVYSLVTKELGRDPDSPIVEVDVGSLDDVAVSNEDDKIDDEDDIDALLRDGGEDNYGHDEL